VKVFKKALLHGRASATEIQKAICFLILVIHGNDEAAQKFSKTAATP
jgi:hypothetical protein